MSEQRVSSSAPIAAPFLCPSTSEVFEVGSVPYLNARPLIFGCPPEHLVLDSPSGLAARFAEGQFAAALLPVFDIFRQGTATLVEDISISCLGPVRSVVIASKGDLKTCEEIEEDPCSLTSNALARVLLSEYRPGFPTIVQAAKPGSENSGRIIIGDRALDFRREHPDWQIWDLGEAWQEHTGLPFVFAAWCLRRPASHKLAQQLRGMRDAGLASLQTISTSTSDPQDALNYLTQNIRYHLGHSEKQALRLFASLCLKHGLLETNPSVLWV